MSRTIGSIIVRRDFYRHFSTEPLRKEVGVARDYIVYIKIFIIFCKPKFYILLYNTIQMMPLCIVFI